MSCPLSLSATHPHFTDEETKGSERGSHLPEVTAGQGQSRAVHEDWCMHERGGREPPNKESLPQDPSEYTWNERNSKKAVSPRGKHQCSHNHRETNRRQTISAKIVKSKVCVFVTV